MGILFFSGYETGDVSEWTGSSGTNTLDSTNPRGGGGYSLKFPWDNGNHYVFTALNPIQSTVFVRFGLYATAAGGATVAWLAELNHSGGVVAALRLVTDGGGGIFLRLFNNVTSAQVGSDYQISPNSWYTVQFKAVISASVGVLELVVDTVVVATGSSLNTGSNNIDSLQMANQNLSGSGATGNIWLDDIMVRNDQYPGEGYCIARQGNTTAPNYNAWTKTGATNIWQIWDNTPYSASTNANTATSAVEQSMVVDFTSVGGTGSTGHGTGNVGSFDLINAFKISVVGKTSGITSDGVDSTIFRTPFGGGGSDTLTALPAAWTTSDSYQETILGATPTLAQVRSCEVGVSKGTGTNTHTVEDVWAMVDFVPIPYVMFQGSENEPYTPLSYDTLMEDTGEEQAWYAPSILDESANLFQVLNILIIDQPSRTYGEYGDTDYFTDINTDSASWFNLVVAQDIWTLIISSQWNNSTVPINMEQLIEESESDYYPDTDIDLGWYIAIFFPIFDPTLTIIANDNVPDADLIDFSDINISSSIGAGPLPPSLVMVDCVPLEMDEMVEDQGDGDFYPDFSIDLAWYFVPVIQVDPTITFNDYAPLELEQLLEDDGSEGAWYPAVEIGLDWFIQPTVVLISSSQWDNQFVEEPELYEEEEGQVFDTPAADILALRYQDIFVLIVSSQWDNQTVDYLEAYSEDAEGDFYPDFGIDNTWYFVQVLPILDTTLFFTDYSEFETEETEGDYYPPKEEELQWFIPTLFTSTTLFGDWVYYALNGQLPITQPTGGLTLFGGATGTANWVSTAFTGTHGFQIQTIAGGTLGYDSQIPTDYLVITGNEMFTVYYTIIDNLPNQIEFRLYETISATWFSAYLGTTDLFGLGGCAKGGIPNILGFWLSVTFTAADLGLVAGNVITGVAYGVYNTTGTSNVAFSDTLSIQTTLQDNLVASQWDNQAVDYFDLYAEDLAEGDYYPDSSIDVAWLFFVTMPPLLIYVDFAPDVYEDDTLDEPAWYAPQDELLSWFIPPPANENYIFTDYSPWELEQLIEDDGSEQAWYPGFGNELENWIFLGATQYLIFSDYTPAEVEQLLEDDGSDVSWYPAFGNELENWLFVQSVTATLVFSDYAPQELEQLIEDLGDEQAWYASFGNESENYSQIITTIMVVFVDYAPTDTEQLTEDDGSEQSWYPPFGNESENYSQIITTIMVVFFDYTPLELDQLIEDDGSELAWYPVFGNELENWIFAPIIPLLVFVDYSPMELDQLTEDAGDDGSWYPAFGNELENWFFLVPTGLETLIATSQWDNQTVDFSEDFTDDLSDPDTYPDTSIDNTWYFVQIAQLSSVILVSINQTDDAGNQVPLSYEMYIEDIGDDLGWYPIEGNILSVLLPLDISVVISADRLTDTPDLYFEDLGDEMAWYPAQDELLSWFIPPQAVALLVFTDYTPVETETLIEESEGDYYPDFSLDLTWYFILGAALFINDYSPLELETVTDDSGEESAWYTPMDVDATQVNVTLVTEDFVFNDYVPLDTDELIDDTGEEQAWYPGLDELLSWFIPLQSTPITIFNDYAPLEAETLIEESEGDYYPSFEIDPTPWFFVVASGAVVIIASTTVTETPEDYILDFGDEDVWYAVTGDILSTFLVAGISILVSVSQEYDQAADFLEMYSEESDADYYPPQDDLFSWFFKQVLVITNFVFIEYNPLELEQLTEESEGDFYPDFSVDPAAWFQSVQPTPTLFSSAIQWDAIPQEIEFLTEDSGEDISWFYPLDVIVVLIGFIKLQFNMPLTNIITLYFNLVEFTSNTTQIIYGN